MTDLSERISYVRARLAYEVDVAAAHDASRNGDAVLVDTRRLASWQHGHITDAVHLPSDRLDGDLHELPCDTPLIVYGWGPGCNGAAHTALHLLELGLDVREMIGGFEYWVRNGFPITSADADATRPSDPLVTAEPTH